MLQNPFVWIGVVAVSVAVGLALREGSGVVWPVAALAMLVFLGGLHIRVRDGALRLTFVPLWRRTIALADVESARLIEYKWVHYGGWGIRWGKQATAYNVWDKQAVRLQLEGRDVVVGSARPRELLDALRAEGVQTVDTTDDLPS